MDLSSYTDTELDQLSTEISQERASRAILATAATQIDQILISVQRALHRAPGAQWTQPTGAHDAYPLAAEVMHGGKLWTSLTTANVWEPGVSAWREVSTTSAAPAWVQPTGYHDAYHLGDRVAYLDSTWTSDVDNNVWAPGTYGWTEEASTA